MNRQKYEVNVLYLFFGTSKTAFFFYLMCLYFQFINLHQLQSICIRLKNFPISQDVPITSKLSNNSNNNFSSSVLHFVEKMSDFPVFNINELGITVCTCIVITVLNYYVDILFLFVFMFCLLL